jgi:hypothetical protein
VAQLNLFDENAPRHNSQKLMEVLDRLNAKEGRETLYFAGQGIQPQWRMKRKCFRRDIPRDMPTCSRLSDTPPVITCRLCQKRTLRRRIFARLRPFRVTDKGPRKWR